VHRGEIRPQVGGVAAVLFLRNLIREGSRASERICVGKREISGRTQNSFKGVPRLQVRRIKRVALAEIAGLVAAAEPADALFGTAVRK
jgi:hypothetical protein